MVEPIIEYVQEVVAGGVDLVIQALARPWAGPSVAVDMISVSNADHSGGYVEVGLLQGSRRFAVATLGPISAGRYASLGGPIYLGYPYVVYARFIYADGSASPACIDGDHCSLAVMAHTVE